MKRVALRALLVLVVFAAVLWAVAPYLSAPKEAKAGAAAEKGWTEKDLEQWLGEGPTTLILLWAPRLLAVLLGVVFLVLEILRADRLRHGVDPSLAKNLENAFDVRVGAEGAPGASGPTVVATPQQALALGLLWPVGVMLASGLLVDPRPLNDAQRMNLAIATSVAAFLPPALLTCLRRLRLGAGRIPHAPAAIAAGLKFVCIALLVVFPVQLLWALAMHLRGVPLEVQDVVQKFARPDDAAQPWVIAIFGTLVAPFTEEGVFRGLLYPAIRGRVPGGPFVAAVLVSLLFAGIHGNLLAAVPLFALALVLTWVMERTNSLLACVVVHAVHNGLSLAPMLWRHATGGS